MNSLNKAAFQMTKYKINKLHFDNPLIDFTDDTTELSYFAASHHEYLDDHWEGSIALGFILIPSATSNLPKEPFFEAIIFGTFTDGELSPDDGKDAFVKKLRINGASTLIPILRAAACSTSALMGFPGKYTLPNINVFSLEWNNDTE